ncbi:hypothetical protein [Streptococcus oricebi]|uniref:Lipoprotein n=1 Tax=Streptococcus oricebi TaxID=1547447 RepID=A0ABS5B3T9_9STRE|nr:hypothetical protein [Streptococcus oricebi]MBP2623497.1 hypothetical protein [Streptococcus oricebi]
MKKKLTFILALLLGGIAMVTLSACGENKNSREWIENKVSEVSRVYPTENLFDLFKEFPEGFKIEQVYLKKGNYSIDFILEGKSDNKTISGKLTKTPSTDDVNQKPDEEIEVNYVNGQFVFSDEQKAKEIWKFGGFLFQKLTLNKNIFSKFKLKEKNYNSVTNGFDISYHLNNRLVNEYFSKKETENSILKIGSSLQNPGYYYYSVIINYDDGFYFRETVSNAEVYNGN